MLGDAAAAGVNVCFVCVCVCLLLFLVFVAALLFCLLSDVSSIMAMACTGLQRARQKRKRSSSRRT